MCECCSIFLSKCKCDYKGVWLIFFFLNRQQNFSIQMNALRLKVAVLRSHRFLQWWCCCSELARGLQETSMSATAPFPFFSVSSFECGFSDFKQPNIWRIFSSVAQKLPFQAFPWRGVPENVSDNGSFVGTKDVSALREKCSFRFYILSYLFY